MVAMRWWAIAVVVLSTVVAVGMDAPRAAVIAQSKSDCMDEPARPAAGLLGDHPRRFQPDEHRDRRAHRRRRRRDAEQLRRGDEAGARSEPDRPRDGREPDAELRRHQQRQRHLRRTITPAGFTVPERHGHARRRRRSTSTRCSTGSLIRSTSWAELDRSRDDRRRSYDGYDLDAHRHRAGPQRVHLHRVRISAGRGRCGCSVPDGATTLINVSGGSFQNPFAGRDLHLGRRHGLRAARATRRQNARSRGAPAGDARGTSRTRAAVTLGGRPGRAWQGSVLAPRARCAQLPAHLRLDRRRVGVGTGEIGVQPAEPVPARPDAVPARRRRRRRRLGPATPTPTPTPTPTSTPTPTPTPIPTVSPTPTPFRPRRRPDADADPDPDADSAADREPEADRHADADARDQRPERAARARPGDAR